MVYFVSHDENTNSLVPFTEPVKAHIGGTGCDYTASLRCHGIIIYERRTSFAPETAHQKFHALSNMLDTLIAYINESVQTAIEEGEVNSIINVKDWEEDLL